MSYFYPPIRGELAYSKERQDGTVAVSEHRVADCRVYGCSVCMPSVAVVPESGHEAALARVAHLEHVIHDAHKLLEQEAKATGEANFALASRAILRGNRGRSL